MMAIEPSALAWHGDPLCRFDLGPRLKKSAAAMALGKPLSHGSSDHVTFRAAQTFI
jgi:hypothetical protein